MLKLLCPSAMTVEGLILFSRFQTEARERKLETETMSGFEATINKAPHEIQLENALKTAVV